MAEREPKKNGDDSTLDEGDSQKKDFSRHVHAVISHFTSTKEGYSRLLHEIDDFVHVVDIEGFLKFVSPSITKFLDYTQNEAIGKAG